MNQLTETFAPAVFDCAVRLGCPSAVFSPPPAPSTSRGVPYFKPSKPFVPSVFGLRDKSQSKTPIIK